MDKLPCKGVVYTVEEGDTLYLISRKFRVPLGFLLKANPMVDIYNLQIGEKICVPGVGSDMAPRPEGLCPYCTLFSYVVKDGDTLEGILAYLGIEMEDLLKYNKNSDLYLKPGTKIMVPRNESEGESQT